MWFDQNALVGGDAWDAKIRKQIKECALFVPIISANTQARREGYFRLEWKLANDRTHLMAHGTPFLLPVCIDGTKDANALVPDSFAMVQWTRLPQSADARNGCPDGGELLATFCGRVKRLLSNAAGGEVPPRVLGAHAPQPAGKVLRRNAPLRRWSFAVAALVLLGAVVLWAPRRDPTPPASAGLPEARQLTLKARALIDDDFLAVRENFRLAEELAKRATTLEPMDGEVWATLARVSVAMLDLNYDRSTVRQEAARSQVERAVRLAPEAVETELAAGLYRLRQREHIEAERHFRHGLAIAPRDPRLAFGLAEALRDQRRDVEASDVLTKHPAFGERDPRPLVQQASWLRNEDFPAAEALLQRSLQLAPSTRGYLAYLSALLVVGDLQTARELIASIPPHVLQEDAVAAEAASVLIWSGDTKQALALLARVPREMLEHSMYSMPKDYVVGHALNVEGRLAAAEAAWNRALAVLDVRLAAEPAGRERWLPIRADLLAATGRAEEGEKIWALLRDLPTNSFVNTPFRRVRFLVIAGRVDEAAQAIAEASLSLRERTMVRLSPNFAEVRRQPGVAERVVEWERDYEEMSLRRVVTKRTAKTGERNE